MVYYIGGGVGVLLLLVLAIVLLSGPGDTVNGVNAGPKHSVPGAQSVDEGNNLTFSTSGGNAISVSDVDVGANDLQVNLSTTDAALTLASTAGLTFSAGGNGSASMTFTGTMASINASFDGLVFAPDVGFSGTSSVKIVTDDQGNSGSGEALTANSTVAITVNDFHRITTEDLPDFEPAVVAIKCLGIDGETIASGTGFFIDDLGGVITNAHVVLGEGIALIEVVRHDGRSDIVARVEAIYEDFVEGVKNESNEEMDLAYLRVPGPVDKYFELSREELKKGQKVFAIGNPLGLENTLSEGIVSGLRDGPGIHTLIQMSADIGPGSSGGPLLNDKGELIGVTTSGYLGLGLNFAMPSSGIKELIKDTAGKQKLIGVINNAGNIRSAPWAPENGFLGVERLETRSFILGLSDLTRDGARDLIGLDEETVIELLAQGLRRHGVPASMLRRDVEATGSASTLAVRMNVYVQEGDILDMMVICNWTFERETLLAIDSEGKQHIVRLGFTNIYEYDPLVRRFPGKKDLIRLKNTQGEWTSRIREALKEHIENYSAAVAEKLEEEGVIP